MSNCFVCCENFNKSTRKKIECPNHSCNFDVCKICVRQYLLTQKEPHCMNCKHGWNQKLIIEQTNKSFFDNQYKISRKQFLLESEISKLPSTIAAAESYKKVKEEEVKIKETCAKMLELKKQLDELRDTKYKIYENIRSLKNTGEKAEDKKKFVMPCPNNDCRGFLSTQYKCEICKLHTCPTCHEIIGHSKTDSHTCNPDSVQSAEFIKKDTKPCPNCGIRIFKISGCDQMWCTECEVAFSWNTGKALLNAVIHNPHFYTRQRNLNNGVIPRAPGDVLCGGLCSFNNLRNHIIMPLQRENEKTEESRYLCNKVLVWHRLVSHITHNELNRIRTRIVNLRDNKELRIQYILNEKTRQELADTVFRNDTILKKLTEIHNIYEILSVVGIELFAHLCNQKLGNMNINDVIKIITDLFNEYKTLIKYSNTQLQDISATFNHSVIQINEETLDLFNKKYTFAMINSGLVSNNS